MAFRYVDGGTVKKRAPADPVDKVIDMQHEPRLSMRNGKGKCGETETMTKSAVSRFCVLVGVELLSITGRIISVPSVSALLVWDMANLLLFALLPMTPGSAFADGVSVRV
jgi:hypothetical protein